MKLFQKKTINCCVCHKDITKSAQWLIADGFICSECQEIPRQMGLHLPSDIEKLHITDIEKMRIELAQGAPTVYRGWGGTLIVFQNDVTITTNFPKGTYTHVSIDDVAFQEPSGTTNGFLIIETPLKKIPIAFTYNERGSFAEAYFHLLQLSPGGAELTESIIEFNETKVVSGILHVDEINKKWYIGESLYDCKCIYNYSDVENTYLLKGDKILSSVSIGQKSGGITRSIIGGAIAGSTGAMIGALTANTKTNSSATESQIIYVNVLVSGLEDPISLSCPNEIVADNVQHAFALMIEQPITPSSTMMPNSTSKADEIRKFKELLDDGIITQEEFASKKKQLLGL